MAHPELVVTAYLGLLGGAGTEFRCGAGFSSTALARHQEKERDTFFYSPLTLFAQGVFPFFNTPREATLLFDTEYPLQPVQENVKIREAK